MEECAGGAATALESMDEGVCPSASFLNLVRLRAILGPGELRPAREGDAGGIARIFNETALDGRSSATDAPWNVDKALGLVRDFEAAGWPLWVAATEGGIAAWVSIRAFSWTPLACQETGETSMFIAGKWQRRGLATHLFQLLAVLAAQHRYHTIVAWILETNTASCRFSRAMGGALWATLPGIARVAGRRVGVRLYAWDVETLESSRLGQRMIRRMAPSLQAPALATATHAAAADAAFTR